MITNTGMAVQAVAVAAAYTYVGIGDTATAESAAHTDLAAATNKKRKAATGTTVTTTQTNDTAQWVATYSSADTISGTWSVVEAAVFTASTAGTMGFRKIFTVKSCNWDAGDTLEVTCKNQQKQGS